VYVVKVDENGRHMDEDARWTLGQFETFDEAEAACRRLVNDCLAEAFEPGMTMAALVNAYKLFGDDPFIVTEAELLRPFSAWAYAQHRAAEMCGT
jgi:hypothetical protein